MKNAHQRIREGMRRNEVELLAHIRREGGLAYLSLLGRWWGAFERLQEAGRIRYNRRQRWYVVVKGAQPVTGVVRK